ncbi:hypothetical protein D9M70_533200 [compost metagenome]
MVSDTAPGTLSAISPRSRVSWRATRSTLTALAVFSCSELPPARVNCLCSPMLVCRSARHASSGSCRLSSQAAGTSAATPRVRLSTARRARSGRSRVLIASVAGRSEKRWRNSCAFCQALSWLLLLSRQFCRRTRSSSLTAPDSSSTSQRAAARATSRASLEASARITFPPAGSARRPGPCSV